MSASNIEEKQNTSDEQEVDLAVIARSVSNFTAKLMVKFVRIILFVKKKIIIIIGLLVFGFMLGLLFDKTNKKYENEIIVTPNLGGVDYLYSKVNLLTAKLADSDTLFLSDLGIKNVKNIKKVEVKPINDVFGFVNNSTSAANAQNTQNFEMIKLLAEESNIAKVIEDEQTGKNFALHTISITTDNKTSKAELIDPILKYLNTDKYYNEVLKISESNVRYELSKNEKQIIQIDSIINKLVINLGKNKSNNLVYSSENDQLNPMFQLKNNLVTTIGNQKIQLIKLNMIIKDVVVTINRYSAKGINGKIKFILPFVLVFLFLLLASLNKFFKSQKIID